ncbi:DNA primase [Actinidia rufa]|uniref:DNA-directed primase/polymerase protein n=1 Tax=Actinidia rufa TaxID=165716 RepID=A0A7J0ECN7_9ERIC|nr:DNA primase [Actinidia rufa]
MNNHFRQGSPCHLYFDLEFNKRDNAEKHGDEMVDLLISVVFDALADKYSIQGEHDWIVELDSSTEEKFSRHLIIRLQKTAFKDNSHAGAFVAEICSRIYEARKSDERLKKLFVSKDSGSTGIPYQLFVDTAVYSRNRCFRLHLSSKAGKNSFLLPSGRFKCKNMSEEDVFMASLICNMDVDCEKLLICKMDMDCVKALDFDTEIHSDFQMQSGASREFMLNSCTSDLSRTYLIGKSPFPALDVFVESIASVGNVSVIYIVDLRRAVYYQKCLDPDCRGYRSPLRPTPKHAIPDATIFSDFVGQNGESVNDNLACHLVANGEEHIISSSDESITDSCKKDGWWVEAVRVAEEIENMNKTLEMVVETQNTLITTLILTLIPFLSKLSQQDKTPDGDEEDWWLAVERTLSQAELTYF